MIRFLIIILSFCVFVSYAQPTRPKSVSEYSRSANVVTWRTSKQPALNEYIRRNVSSLAYEDESLNELAKKALYYYLTKDPTAHRNVPSENSPKFYIPDGLRFDLRVLEADRNYYSGYLNNLDSYLGMYYRISNTNIDYQGNYVERYGSVWIDRYNPESGTDDGFILIIMKLWYDDGHKVWTQNADIDF